MRHFQVGGHRGQTPNANSIEKVKRRLEKIRTQGPRLLSGPDHALNEDYSAYGELNNKLEWEIESNKGNDIKV